jgi:hypothetical protein
MKIETMEISKEEKLEELYHYCSNPLENITPRFYDNGRNTRRYASKPYGLWVSVEQYEEDQTWKAWCEKEKFSLEDLRYRYHIKLNENAKLLHLKTTDHIVNFSLEYQANDQEDFEDYVSGIKWEEVVKLWDGIVIAPYNWECRLLPKTGWYYGWDCASGCVWNISMIESFSLRNVF